MQKLERGNNMLLPESVKVSTRDTEVHVTIVFILQNILYMCMVKHINSNKGWCMVIRKKTNKTSSILL